MTETKVTLAELLFLSDITLPATQAEIGILDPIVHAADQTKELSPFEVWEKIRSMDSTNPDYEARISSVAPAVQYFKKQTILKALEMCPAFETVHAQAAVVALPVDQYDTVLTNLSTVLERNPLTDEGSMTALVDLGVFFGEPITDGYEPAVFIDPASLDALQNGTTADTPQASEETVETPAENVAETDLPIPGVEATEETPVVAPTETPVETPVEEPADVSVEADKALVVAETAAPALTTREMAMVNAHVSAAKKLNNTARALLDAQDELLTGVFEATAPTLPETVEA